MKQNGGPPPTIQELLKVKHKIVFRPTPGRHGAILADNTMELDPRTGGPLAHTILHELLHALKPLWSEWRVARETTRLWGKATWQEKAALYKLCGKAMIWAGEDSIPEEQGNEPNREAEAVREVSGGTDPVRGGAGVRVHDGGEPHRDSPEGVAGGAAPGQVPEVRGRVFHWAGNNILPG